MGDSGASVCMADESVAFIEENKSDISVELADGSLIKSGGWRKINISFSGNEVGIWCLILKRLPTRVMLGWNFIKENLMFIGRKFICMMI
jgi:hypothetical protein